MSKSGHIGVVMNAQEPIIKTGLTHPQIRRKTRQNQLNGNSKSMNLINGEFSQRLIRNKVDSFKWTSNTNDNCNTLSLIQKHLKKSTENLTKTGKIY